MHCIQKNNCFIYFGSEKNNLQIDGNYVNEKFLALKNNIETATKKSLNTLFFLKQTHSATVFTLKYTDHLTKPLDLFQHEGDAIITQEKNIGIGIVTADCFPIVLQDQKNQAIGIIHAGWRGLQKKIITITIQKMQKTFKTNPLQLQVYCGPAALVCCYEVQVDFLSYFPEDLIEKQGKNFFFNTHNAVLFELAENNVPTASIDMNNNFCTICTPGFCSVRKQKHNAGRQPSVVCL